MQLSRLVLVLVPLLGGAVAAKPNPERVRKDRRVTLSVASAEIRVAPGTVTTLVFNASLDRESVELDRARFALADVGDRSINLEPVAELKEEVALRVRFTDASRPESATFSLATHPFEVDSQVRVFRDARSPEALQAQVVELEARCAACEAELTAQRERARASGPAGMVLAKRIGAKGVSVAQLKQKTSPGAGDVRAASIWLYLSENWVVFAMDVQHASGPPWRPGKALLVSESTGKTLEAITTAMDADVLLPRGEGRVVAEFARSAVHPGEVFRFVVPDSDGDRSLSVTGVVIMNVAQEKIP